MATRGISSKDQPVKKNAAKKTGGKKAVSVGSADKKTGVTAISGNKAGNEKKQHVAGKIVKVKDNTTRKTVTKTPAKKGAPVKKSDPNKYNIIFRLHFHTTFGQDLFISGDHPSLNNNEPGGMVPMQYFDEEHWQLSLTLDQQSIPASGIRYNYILRNADGSFSYDWGSDKKLVTLPEGKEEALYADTWNYAGDAGNVYSTEPFENVFLKKKQRKIAKADLIASITHLFKAKAPLLSKDQILCITGGCSAFGNWDITAVLPMQQGADSIFSISLDLSKEVFPLSYKYGVYDTAAQKFIRFEDGNNRILYDQGSDKKLRIINDGFAMLPQDTWKGAGVSIPVFSLRSNKSFGTGEFMDLKLMIDWAKAVGLKMIQVLPVNDTMATNTAADSYPYSAISAFALHPLYLDISAISDKSTARQLKLLEPLRKRLNALDTVDYVSVIQAKLDFAALVYKTTKGSFFSSSGYLSFFKKNEHWLVPYAAFCYLRNKYQTANFTQWPAYNNYNRQEIEELGVADPGVLSGIHFYYFLQYHLHTQLTETAKYAKQHGVILKGDIAIGVSRYSADTWQDPALYNSDLQAGAPPDDFAIAGQNWGFPTYNWQQMQQNGYAWWKQRFEQMSSYFDAFRIDHILGFFRIWSVPMDAVQGIMGHFVPAIPVHINEFHKNGIWFDHDRYTRPFITESVLQEVFGTDSALVKTMFLSEKENGWFEMKNEFSTQRLIESHFESLEKDEYHERIKTGLYTLISNLILFASDEDDGMHFHFRFAIESTSSFQHLDVKTQQQLKALYVDYFYKRQEELWKNEGLQRLPALKRVTNMLVCGEDLGLVPACVPVVMKELGLLSLEIQRMPKDPAKEFFHPNDAPFLSVVTPSTHDMSTVRGWWEEDRKRTQQFYNHELGQTGEAPVYCEPWINKAIVLQHLYSPAMWSVFLLQDLLGINDKIRRDDPGAERINIPADPKHYWRYRMHLTLEELLNANTYTEELKSYITASGR